MDEIYIKGLKIFAYHGVNPEETENGQEFELDIFGQTKRRFRRYNQLCRRKKNYKCGND